MATKGRLEARIKVPTGGWEGTVDGNTFTVAAGYYYMSSADGDGGGSTSFLAVVEAALEAAVAKTFTVALSGGESSRTGLVTITASAAAAINWVSTDLRQILGFDGNLASNTSWTSESAAKSVWLPDCHYVAPNAIDGSWRGFQEGDQQSVQSPSGYAWSHMGEERTALDEGDLAWEAVSRKKAIQANEETANESWERFAREGIWGTAAWGTAGGPIRFYPDADAATTFATWHAMSLRRVRPTHFSDGFPGGAWTVRLPRLLAVPGALDEGTA